jgi:hypothetical protein
MKKLINIKNYIKIPKKILKYKKYILRKMLMVKKKEYFLKYKKYILRKLLIVKKK